MVEPFDILEFNTIVWRTQSRIRAFIAGMGAAAHEVDDLAQDVYLEVYRNFDKMPVDIVPERWIKGIAKNVCLNHFRCAARRGRLHREALAEILATTQGQLDPMMDAHSVSSVLSDCIVKLQSDQRRLIELRYQEDFTSTMIGKRLNSTAEAVRMSLSRIRTALKNCVVRTLAATGE